MLEETKTGETQRAVFPEHLNRFLTTALSFYRAYCKHTGCTHLLQPRYDTVIVKQVIAGQLSDALLHAVVFFAYWAL